MPHVAPGSLTITMLLTAGVASCGDDEPDTTGATESDPALTAPTGGTDATEGGTATAGTAGTATGGTAGTATGGTAGTATAGAGSLAAS